MKNFTQLFEIIYQKFYTDAKNSGIDERDISLATMMRFLGVSSGKFFAWKKGQWPSADDLESIATKLGFSYRWLVTGTGDPFGDDAPTPMPAMPEAAPEPEKDARIAELEAELRSRERELLEAKSEIIALQRRLLKRHPDRK